MLLPFQKYFSLNKSESNQNETTKRMVPKTGGNKPNWLLPWQP